MIEHTVKTDNPELKVVDEPLVGAIVGEKYRILRLLGRGGMGSVYAAEHILLKKTVALKLLHSGQTDVFQALARFRNEAEVTAAIDHPNVVSVMDMGVLPDGNAYLAMELIEGRSLSEIIKEQGKLDIKRALPLFIQICDALNTAHAKGVLHRDLKPANVIMVEERGRERVKVVDFGIAKMQESDQHLTQTGEVFGSPHYMSPEQGQGYQVTASADIYSLGCLMYETLTGSPPFKGDTPLEVIMQHVQATPPDLVLDLPAERLKELRAIIDKTLSKEPDKRFSSAADLAAALEKLNDRFNPKLITPRRIAAAVAALGIATIAFCTINPDIRIPITLRLEGRQLELGRYYLNHGNFAEAERELNAYIVQEHSKPEALERMAGSSAGIKLLADAAEAAELSQQKSHARGNWNQTLWTIGREYSERLIGNKKYSEAEQCARDLARWTASAVGSNTNQYGISMRLLGTALLAQGKTDEANQCAKIAEKWADILVEDVKKGVKPRSTTAEIAADYAFIGDYYAQTKQLDKAMENFNKAISFEIEGLDQRRLYQWALEHRAQTAMERGIPFEISGSSLGLGRWYVIIGRTAEGIAMYERALKYAPDSQGKQTIKNLLGEAKVLLDFRSNH